VDVTRLKGSILIIDDQMMDRSLFIHLLKSSSLRVTEAGTPDEAIALVVRSLGADNEKSALATGPFDLIVCDLNLGDVPGETVIKQIREKGYRGPLLVMTAETVPERIAAALAAGGTAIFQKPYTAEKLHTAIAAQMGERCMVIDDPIYSPLCADPANRVMVEKYVSQVRLIAAELRKFAGEDNLPQVRVLCQSLKGTGVGYGFPALTDVASAAIVSLDASCSVPESITDLHRLDAICSRLTSAEPPQQGKPRR
jgi:CheY-like chemotaxis protein